MHTTWRKIELDGLLYPTLDNDLWLFLKHIKYVEGSKCFINYTTWRENQLDGSLHPSLRHKREICTKETLFMVDIRIKKYYVLRYYFMNMLKMERCSAPCRILVDLNFPRNTPEVGSGEVL